jgi:Xaa-Pro aminopeptidase
MHQLDLELVSRAAAAMGVLEAVVDPEMPIAVADRLRADGIVLRPDHDAIASRRRVKSPAELAGMRRAQAAAESGMRAAADLLRQAVPARDGLLHEGKQPIQGSTRRRASSSRLVTASGSPCTRIRRSVRPGTIRWWPET